MIIVTLESPLCNNKYVQVGKLSLLIVACKVDPFVKTGGRAVVRATFLLFLSLRCLFYNKSFVVPVE